MQNVNDPCLGCAIVSGSTRPVGGLIARAPGLVLHGSASPSPVPGWAVISSQRHVRALYDLDDEAAQQLGPFAARVMRAQRKVLGAQHVYAFAIGDVLHHFHLHLVPRFADTPQHLWGRSIFDAPPAEHLAAGPLEQAAQRLAQALAAGP